MNILKLFSKKKPVTETKEKKVLAVITEEEAQKFLDVAAEASALKTILDDLIEKRAETVIRKHVLWQEIRKKYNLVGTELTINHSSREITEDDD